jgi:3-hydroxyisobutyrate dehydrogenase-like beta-hydroxyacid dehydrogenase
MAVPGQRAPAEPGSTVVGMVGLGEMGMPMVKRLRGAGYDVRFFARRPEVVEEASALGAVPADSAAEMAALADVAIVCVYSDDQVREVALGPDGVIDHLRAGAILCNHTTGRPSTGQALLAAATARGVGMLDCALSGGPDAILAGDLTLLIGGDRALMEQVTPVLASYSAPILHVGEVGDGQKVKLLNNALFGAQVALAVQIERTATAMGMDPALVLPAIHECSGDSYALAAAIGLGSAARMVELAGRFVRKDVAVCVEVAGDLGADLGSVLTVAQEV